jgi:anti-sigma regulatory factor (Ser/Thr protein kinase)
MREISLHILDLVENSIAAGASLVSIEVDENSATDRLVVTVADNGQGMDEEYAKKVLDPFVTSRTTRRVGLGLPLVRAATERCAGELTLETARGQGTVVRATFQRSHIDRPPLGDIRSTLLALIIGRSDVDILYVHRVDAREFTLDTREIKQTLGDVSLTDPSVISWLKEYLDQDLKEVA